MWWARYKTTRRWDIRLGIQCCQHDESVSSTQTCSCIMARRQRVNANSVSVQKWPKNCQKNQFCVIWASFLRVSAQKSIRSLSEFGVSFCTSPSLVVSVVLDTNTRSTRAIQTATIARLLHRHHCGVPPGTTIPIARLARPCGQQSEGLTPCSCSSPSPTNLTTSDPAHLHGLTHQSLSHPPPRSPTPYAVVKTGASKPSAHSNVKFTVGKYVVFPDGVLAVGQPR